MLLRAASSQEQLKRVLDSFDIDGDTVCRPLLQCYIYSIIKQLLGKSYSATYTTTL